MDGTRTAQPSAVGFVKHSCRCMGQRNAKIQGKICSWMKSEQTVLLSCCMGCRHLDWWLNQS